MKEDNNLSIPGLNIDYLIRKNDRYATYKVIFEGKPAFIKQALTPKTQKDLQRQISGVRWTNQIGSKMDQFPLRAPLTLSFGDDYLITEWIDTPDIHAESLDNPEATAEIFASWMKAYDEWGKRPWPYKPKYSSRGMSIEQDLNRLKSGMSKYVDAGLIEQGLIDEGVRVFNDLFPKLEARLQDADIKPMHIFHDPNLDNGFVMIDSEWIRRTWPRFYDLGNLAAKYWVVYDDHKFANHLITTVSTISEATEEELVTALRATCIIRAFSFHLENRLDSDSSDPGVIIQAQKLLKLGISATSIKDFVLY